MISSTSSAKPIGPARSNGVSRAFLFREPGQGHPIWYLTVSLARGRTEKISVSEEYVSSVKEWIKNCGHGWINLDEVAAINRELLGKR